MKYKGHFHVHHETHDTQFILYQLSNRSLIRLAFLNNSHSTPSTHLRNAVGFGRTGFAAKTTNDPSHDISFCTSSAVSFVVNCTKYNLEILNF